MQSHNYTSITPYLCQYSAPRVGLNLWETHGFPIPSSTGEQDVLPTPLPVRVLTTREVEQK